MEKILITGGAGFIGSHLAERLFKEGNEVVVIDDLSTGRRSNISQLKDKRGFKFYEDSVLDSLLMEKLVSNSESVYHLAASVGVRYVIEDPLRSMLINAEGTRILLEIAAQFKPKVFLASTSEIYGKNEEASLSEDDDRILGSTRISRWSYSCTKAFDELLGLAYYRQKALPVVIGRFFNVCGPRQVGDYGMVIPRFIRQALSGEPITVYGDGEQVRTFTYITDAVEAAITLLQHPQARGEVFNIGSHEGISIEKLASKIKELTGSSSKIVHIPYEEAYAEGFEDMRRRVPNTKKLEGLIGFSPKIGLDEMLKRIIDEE